MKKFASLIFCSLWLITAVSSHAAYLQDNDNGLYTDDFANNSGVPTRTSTNVTAGKLQLTNASNGFTAPYVTTGTAITRVVSPLMVAKWGTINITSTTPPGTSIKIQVLDSGNPATLYSDIYLPGNSIGFTNPSVDISVLPLLKQSCVYCDKIPRIRFKFTLTTSDPNITPTIDSISFSWTLKQGDLSTSLLADTDWPLYDFDSKSTLHTKSFNPDTYPAIRWVSPQFPGNNPFTSAIYTYDNSLLVTNGVKTNPEISRYNLDTGEKIFSSVSDSSHLNGVITQNGTFYTANSDDDIFVAYDLVNGYTKWTYAFYGGHGNDQVVMGSDGTLFTTRSNNLTAYYNSHTVTLYAFNQDGTIKFTKDYTAEDYHSGTKISTGSDGTLYFATINTDEVGDLNGNGKLYAVSPDDGAVKWTHPIGDVMNLNNNLVIDSDDTIYVGNHAFWGDGRQKKLYAINSDGTLKWEKLVSEGLNDNGFLKLSLRSDRKLTALYSRGNFNDEFLMVFDTDNGELLWKSNQDNINTYNCFFTDSRNGLFYASKRYSEVPNDSYAKFNYLDSNNNLKWNLTYPYTQNFDGAAYYRYYFSTALQDKKGWLYGTFGSAWRDSEYDDIWSSKGNAIAKTFALAPWTLSASTSLGTSYAHSNDKVTITATTAMARENLLFGGNNSIQLVADTGDKVPLVYDSTNSSGDTIWKAEYQLPQNYPDGNHTFTIEAAQAYLQTDIPLHFDNPPPESSNTGITLPVTIQVDNSAPALTYTDSHNSTQEFTAITADNTYTDDDLPTLCFRPSLDNNSGLAWYHLIVDGKDYVKNINPTPPSDKDYREDSDKAIYYSPGQICAKSKRSEDKLNPGAYKWQVKAEDKAGNTSETSQKILRVKTHQAIFSDNQWFPLTLESKVFADKSIKISGITNANSHVTLKLIKDNQTKLEKQVIASADSKYAFGLTHSLPKGEYLVQLSATNDKGDYIEVPEFKVNIGNNSKPTVIKTKTSPVQNTKVSPQLTQKPTAVAITTTPPSTPTPASKANSPQQFCFFKWCW